MDDHRVDALTRSLSSRRTALGGLLGGGLAALLDLPAPKEAAAHDFRDRCRRIEDPPRRRACLRRARAHNCKHRQSTPPPCVPQLLAITCAPAAGCGVRPNNCGQATACYCPPGKGCIANGSCARSCPGSGQPGCPPGCQCSVREVGTGVNYCTPMHGCSALPPGTCSSTAQCPPNHYCAPIICGGPTDPEENRCRPFCSS